VAAVEASAGVLRSYNPIAVQGLLQTGLNVRDAEDVARYLDAFDRLVKVAVTGDEARSLLGRVAEDLRATREEA
jgi:hypothetical protein